MQSLRSLTAKEGLREGQKESDVLRQCLEYLKMLGVFCWRNNTGAAKIGNRFMRFGLKGSSDILGIMPDGRFLAVECKREKGGRLSEEQVSFLEAIRSRGGIAVCANSVQELERNVLSYFSEKK